MWAVFMFQGHGNIISLCFLLRIFSFSQSQNFEKLFYQREEERPEADTLTPTRKGS